MLAGGGRLSKKRCYRRRVMFARRGVLKRRIDTQEDAKGRDDNLCLWVEAWILIVVLKHDALLDETGDDGAV